MTRRTYDLLAPSLNLEGDLVITDTEAAYPFAVKPDKLITIEDIQPLVTFTKQLIILFTMFIVLIILIILLTCVFIALTPIMSILI